MAPPQSVNLFFSWAHANLRWWKRLCPLLKFEHDDRAKGLNPKNVRVWHDQQLGPGTQWDPEIKLALDVMDIFVPLISVDYFASEYVMNVEVPRARQRYEKGEIAVVPILLYDVNLRKKCEFLHRFQPLPTPGKCWRVYEQEGDYRDAHRLLEDGLWLAIETVLRRKASDMNVSTTHLQPHTDLQPHTV